MRFGRSGHWIYDASDDGGKQRRDRWTAKLRKNTAARSIHDGNSETLACLPSSPVMLQKSTYVYNPQNKTHQRKI